VYSVFKTDEYLWLWFDWKEKNCCERKASERNVIFLLIGIAEKERREINMWRYRKN
jgi:hypothetical protein